MKRVWVGLLLIIALTALAACTASSPSAAPPTSAPSASPTSAPTTTSPETTTTPTIPPPATVPSALNQTQLFAALTQHLPVDQYGNGVTYVMTAAQPPRKPGDQWVVDWGTQPPPGLSIGLLIYDSAQSATDSVNQKVTLDSQIGLNDYTVPAPPGMACSPPAAYENYNCEWADSNISLLCAGSGPSQACSAPVLDVQADLRAVDPAGGF